MERLERVVVHVEEALRLAGMPDEPHQRLALMLLDSAAELLLHRACERKLRFAAIEERLLEVMREARDRGVELDEDDIEQLSELERTCPARSSAGKLSDTSTRRPSSSGAATRWTAGR